MQQSIMSGSPPPPPRAAQRRCWRPQTRARSAAQLLDILFLLVFRILMCCVMLQQSIASGSFSPSRAAAEALLTAVDENARRHSASDHQPPRLADMQALIRDSRRQSLRMPTTAPNVPERRPSIGQLSRAMPPGKCTDILVMSYPRAGLSHS